ncbi:MAG: hypothetical protein H7138_00615 [Myxococcales bacterium]|nr:hypothetical protein [Myxococcales bacterium]
MLITNLRTAIGVVLGAALAGCGLISSDVTDFDLTLPDKKFTIDVDGWSVDDANAATYLERSCAGAPPTACNSAVQEACATGCSGSCNETSQTCDLTLEVSRVQPVNLVMEKPELQSLNDEPVIKVTIDSITYDVAVNTLNIDTPPITVYIAPISVTTVRANDPSVKAIGTIDPVPAGQTTTTAQPLKLTATGKAELVTIMSNFKTPFNVLVGSSIVVTAGQDIPTGKLDAVVHIKGHAGI